MEIDHIAVWCDNLDKFIDFYVKYFHATPGPRYLNPNKGFQSIFLTFTSGSRLEAMQTTAFTPLPIAPGAQRIGLTHFAISVGSQSAVDRLTARLIEDGFPLINPPRHTSDG
jgi:lactoylglutathione lyase